MDIRKRLEELKIGEKIKHSELRKKLSDTAIGETIKETKLGEIDIESVKWEDVILVAAGVSLATASALTLFRRAVRMTQKDDTHSLFYLIPPALGVAAGGMIASLPMREDIKKVEMDGELFSETDEKKSEEIINEELNDTAEKVQEQQPAEKRDIPVDTDTSIQDFENQ